MIKNILLTLSLLCAWVIGVFTGYLCIDDCDDAVSQYSRGFFDGIVAKQIEKPEILEGGREYVIQYFEPPRNITIGNVVEGGPYTYDRYEVENFAIYNIWKE